MTPPAFSFLFPVALHDTCLPVFHRFLREHAFQVGGVTILRNFFVLFLVFFFTMPASGALEATAELYKTPVFCNETITFQVRLEHCRKLKTFGDLERFFEEAFNLQQKISNRLPKTDRTDRTGEGFARLAEQVKYGGAKPSSAEIEACFRALERLVQNVSNR